jgi:hypothetical protein
MVNAKRCAVYTRKSSEEGLEQDFNSLHAQREACEAFIKSQAGSVRNFVCEQLVVNVCCLMQQSPRATA